MTFFPSRISKTPLGSRRGRDDLSAVPTGAIFARINATQVVETACVLGVAQHGGSVPHVRYNCMLHCADRVFEDGPRMLALPAFLARFERTP